MKDLGFRSTVRFGNDSVPVLRRDWRHAPDPQFGYRVTHGLSLGQSWLNADTVSSTTTWRERYAMDRDGNPVPVGAMIARELKADGASEASFVELFGKYRMAGVDEDLVCVVQLIKGQVAWAASHVETGKILARFLAERGSFGGFPDAIAVFPDGRIALREAKNIAAKDQLRQNQHEVADTMRQLFGRRADLALVEWEFEH